MTIFRYIKVGGGLLWGEHELTKEMLAMVKSGQYDTIIDLHTFTKYDAEENKWDAIDGTASKTSPSKESENKQ